MIYNVTKLFDEYSLNALKAFLNVHKIQVFYSDTLNNFSLNLIESCSKSRKDIVRKVIERQMSTIPITELINCPKINIIDKATKRRRMF